jgi:hypothetical protein
MHLKLVLPEWKHENPGDAKDRAINNEVLLWRACQKGLGKGELCGN